MAEAALMKLMTILLQDQILVIVGTSHRKMINEVENEIQRMQNEFCSLRDLCRDADITMHPDELRELDLERLMKEVVYDIEDIVESWFIQMEDDITRNKIGRKFLIHAHGSQLKREIKSFREGRLEPINRRIQAFRDLQLLQIEADPVHSMKLNKEEPKIEAEIIVGFEDEAKTLISYLMEETEDLDVISITGMPGIGKTTLARKIYQDKRIRDEFPTRIWFHDIPLDLRPRYWCLNILERFDKNDGINDDEGINDDALIDRVQACLKKSRFLLVLDEVWSADTLRSVTSLLPKTGKVLITSRDTNVCADANVARKPHKLRFLNENDSWDLLQLEVFGKLDACPQELRSSGKCIAKRCDGSPLAIVVVGRSLVVTSSTEAGKNLNGSLWRTVSENITTYVADYGQQCIFSRVELSYLKLPLPLQHCFLYLGMFPEDDEIPVRTLTRLWIAEGLLQDSRGVDVEGSAEQILEETAEKYLCRLIDTNLVMVGKTYHNGQIKTCRLHKVIYGFCKYKAAEQEVYQEMTSDSPISLKPKCRRLCIYSHLSRFLSSRPKGPCVRSILCLDKEDKVLQPKYSSIIPKYFKLLRVLECKYHRYTKFPTYLTELKHLRYISISGDDHLDVMPETISSLHFLKSLVVDTQSPVLILKANIWRMLKLRHLVTKAAIVLAIRETDHKVCECLQTLTRLAAAYCTEVVFEKAPNLKTLGIRGELYSLLAAETLGKLERLENLKLINESAAADTHLHRHLHPNCFPPSLKRLTLSATYLGWESMSVLGKISSLEILKLKNNAFMGEYWKTDADGFRGLVFLLIGTTDLASWEASADCFPRLECLVLNNCEKLQKIPSSLEKILHTMDADMVSDSAVEPAREIEGEIVRVGSE